MSKQSYNKPALTVDQQIDQPCNRGMVIDNTTQAKHYLSQINYYRLTAYWLPFESDHATHDFQKRVNNYYYGTDVVWSDELDMPADTLWRLAQEQSGVTMTAEAFHHWRERKAYTLDAAAAALGISRRMVAYYDHGDKPIPRVVALATLALDPSSRAVSSMSL
jgi:hypothetical protein